MDAATALLLHLWGDGDGEGGQEGKGWVEGRGSRHWEGSMGRWRPGVGRGDREGAKVDWLMLFNDTWSH